MATTALHLYGSTGKPWSFSPKAETLVTDTNQPSFFLPQQTALNRRDFFPASGSFFGPVQFRNLFRWLRPAGA